MYSSVKFLHPIVSWLCVSASILADMALSLAKDLSPCISIHFWEPFWVCDIIFSSQLDNSSVFTMRSRIRVLSGHIIRCEAHSRNLQIGHHWRENVLPELQPTCTLVLQKPEFWLDPYILYMSDLFFRVRLRCSQLTLSN
jgi:hypothetical protein